MLFFLPTYAKEKEMKSSAQNAESLKFSKKNMQFDLCIWRKYENFVSGKW